MPEELENNEETPETPGTNNVPTEDELEVIKAELEAERTALAEKDTRIAELEAQLNEVTTAREAFAAQLYEASDAHTQAVARYLEAVKAANPAIPQDVITGDTIDAIDASLGKALTIAEAVKANLAAEAQNTRVPAGAPTRAVNLEGLTADELIRLGISQGGNS